MLLTSPIGSGPIGTMGMRPDQSGGWPLQLLARSAYSVIEGGLLLQVWTRYGSM